LILGLDKFQNVDIRVRVTGKIAVLGSMKAWAMELNNTQVVVTPARSTQSVRIRHHYPSHLWTVASQISLEKHRTGRDRELSRS